MLNYLKDLAKSRFVRNVFIVATGTAGAQAITIAFAPIITRLYGPEAFGLLGTFMAILAIATPIAALTYPIAIVLPKADDEARGIARLSASIALFMAFFLAGIITLCGDRVSAALNISEISIFLLLIPVAMLFSALQQIMQQWLIRKKQFKMIAKVAVSQSLMLNLSKVGIGLLNPLGAVLIVLSTLSNALYAAQLWFGVEKWADKDGRISNATSGSVSLKKLARQYRDFPCYRAPQVFLNAVSQGLPVLMLAGFYGPASAGFYTIGKTVLGVPIVLVGQSLSSVFYPKFNDAIHDGQNGYGLLFKATALLAVIGILPFGLIVAIGPWLFSLVFGDEWVAAGIYAQWLSLWLYFMFISRPVISAIPVLSIQRVFLIYEVVGFFLRTAALCAGFLLYESAIISIALFCITNSLMYIFLIITALVVARNAS